MAEGVGEIASSAETVTTTALDTSAKSEAGGNSVKKAIEQMSSIQDTVTSLSEIIQVLGERSSEIGKILTVIQDISSQTNLLALNAQVLKVLQHLLNKR